MVSIKNLGFLQKLSMRIKYGETAKNFYAKSNGFDVFRTFDGPNTIGLKVYKNGKLVKAIDRHNYVNKNGDLVWKTNVNHFNSSNGAPAGYDTFVKTKYSHPDDLLCKVERESVKLASKVDKGRVSIVSSPDVTKSSILADIHGGYQIV